jgi:PLP dependent protein
MVSMSYQDVIERVSIAAERAGGDRGEITLVAVSKSKTVDEILTVYEQGHRDFGENRANEMSDKVGLLPRDINWHFVGALQSNKTRLIRSSTHLLHSMDRTSLAAAWAKGPGLAPPVLLQVNIGREPQKSGVAPEDTETMADSLIAMGMDVTGLMAIPPLGLTAEDSRRYFSEMRGLLDRVSERRPDIRQLSMGMTDDFEVAIAEGASIIRVGRAIFGERT